MEERLNEGGDPGFLGHGDLVWICRDKTERLQIQFNARIIPVTTFTLTHTGTCHILGTVPSSLYPCQYVWDFGYLCRATLSRPGRVTQSKVKMWPKHTISSRYTGLFGSVRFFKCVTASRLQS